MHDRPARPLVVLLLAAAALSAQPQWSRAHVLFARETPVAFDAARGRAVIFGGTHDKYIFGDTWEWDGVAWLARTPTLAPTPRYTHTLAYDLTRKRTVLFGGRARNAMGDYYADDTWEWDGSDWTQRTTVVRPPARMQHAMAWDAQRARVVLFGGSPLGGGWFRDTWEWDGATWTQRQPQTTPPALTRPLLAYDWLRSRTVMF